MHLFETLVMGYNYRSMNVDVKLRDLLQKFIDQHLNKPVEAERYIGFNQMHNETHTVKFKNISCCFVKI